MTSFALVYRYRLLVPFPFFLFYFSLLVPPHNRLHFTWRWYTSMVLRFSVVEAFFPLIFFSLMRKPFFLIFGASLLLAQCKKQNSDPASRLPPATQTGANTFGCILNGKPWTPQGNDGTSNYTVTYYRTQAQGELSIAAYAYENNLGNKITIGIGSDSLNSVGKYKITKSGRHTAGVINRDTNCEYYSQDKSTFCKGKLTITRFDLQNNIISGTFEFVLAKPDCDTIRITNGRFDKKL